MAEQVKQNTAECIYLIAKNQLFWEMIRVLCVDVACWVEGF
jgi:hypothetical protein